MQNIIVESQSHETTIKEQLDDVNRQAGGRTPSRSAERG
jgi:hypothetical protein